MAWLETDRHGRLRIGFKYYDGLKCREPLGVSANKQTIAEARRLCATIQLELKARTFDYAKRFPDSDRIKQRGIETPEKIQPISVTELADSWLLSKQGEVKKSTHGYYKEVAGIFIQRDAIGTKMVSELRQEDIDRWRVRVRPVVHLQRTPPPGRGACRGRWLARGARTRILRRPNPRRNDLTADGHKLHGCGGVGRRQPFDL